MLGSPNNLVRLHRAAIAHLAASFYAPMNKLRNGYRRNGEAGEVGIVRAVAIAR